MVSSAHRPRNLEQLSLLLSGGAPKRLIGLGTKRSLLAEPDAGEPLDLAGLSGILRLEADDQWLECWAGTPVQEIQEALQQRGLCLPLADPKAHGTLAAGIPGTIGGLVACAIPHGHESAWGPVANWVLGTTAVRADGTVVRTGGITVKNVAGYDVTRLLVGSRGVLAALAKVTLRAFPSKAIREPSTIPCTPWDGGPLWIQRVRMGDYAAALEHAQPRLLCHDPRTCTLWLGGAEMPNRWPEDWAMGAGYWRTEGAGAKVLTERALSLFNPDRRLNPGEASALLRVR